MNKVWPHYSADEIQAVEKVLCSGKVNYWTGTEGRELEKEFAAFHGCKYAVAVANGTVALELTLVALGISVGDEVIVTPRTFVASASAIVMRGAKPIFADVDLISQNITAESIQAVLTPRTKAIICVHLAGWPCEMDEIMALAAEHNLYVIEDCAQAHGARYQNKLVGTWGHIGAFSFCQDKIISTGGEGGMVITDDESLWKKMWSFKDHGKSYDTVYHVQHPPGFRWLHEEFGTNWRMTEMQAAIGRCQLRKLTGWLTRRREIATQLKATLEKLAALFIPPIPEDVFHAYYRYYFFIRPEKLKSGWDRDRIMQEINAHGVNINVGSCAEIYLEKCFDKYQLQPARPCFNARELGKNSLALPIHHYLTAEAVQEMVTIIASVVTEGTVGS